MINYWNTLVTSKKEENILDVGLYEMRMLRWMIGMSGTL